MSSKRLIFFFLFLFSLYNLSSQTIWSKKYKFTDFSIDPSDMMLQSNGKIVVGGYYNATGSGESRTAFLFTVDHLNGDSLSLSTCIAGFGCDLRQDILLVSEHFDDKIFTVGNQSFGSSDYLALVDNTKNDLSFNWLNDELILKSIHHINRLETVSDGVVIAGSFSTFEYFLMKFNFEGEKVWEERIPVSDIGFEPLLSVLPNGNIALVYTVGLNDSETFLRLHDHTGSIIYNRRLEMDVVAINATVNNELLTIQSKSEYTQTSFFVVKYTQSNEELILNGENEFNSPRNILSNDNNEIFIIENSISNSGIGFLVHKLSSEGNSIWNRNYAEEGYHYDYYDSEIDGDNSLFILGRTSNTQNLSNREVLLLGIDVSSSVSSKNVLNSKYNSMVYPNPAFDFIDLKLSSEAENKVSLFELYKMNGELIKKDQYKINNRISLKGFSSGVYFLRLLDDEGNSISFDKIVKYDR